MASSPGWEQRDRAERLDRAPVGAGQGTSPPRTAHLPSLSPTRASHAPGTLQSLPCKGHITSSPSAESSSPTHTASSSSSLLWLGPSHTSLLLTFHACPSLLATAPAVISTWKVPWNGHTLMDNLRSTGEWRLIWPGLPSPCMATVPLTPVMCYLRAGTTWALTDCILSILQSTWHRAGLESSMN